MRTLHGLPWIAWAIMVIRSLVRLRHGQGSRDDRLLGWLSFTLLLWAVTATPDVWNGLFFGAFCGMVFADAFPRWCARRVIRRRLEEQMRNRR